MESIFSFVSSINSDVESRLKKHNIKTRPGASPGVWLSFLLPLAVLTSLIKFPDTTLHHQRAGLISVGLLLVATLDLIYRKFLTKKHGFSLIVTGLCTGLLLFRFNSDGIFLCSIWGLCSVFSYELVQKKVLKSCPFIFTFGEATVVSQALILFVFSACSNIHNAWYKTPQSCFGISTTILEVGLVGITLICGIVHSIPGLRKPSSFYAVCAVVLVGLVVPTLYLLLEQNPILWILQLLVANIPRMVMVIYWIMCVIIAVFAVTSQINIQKKASTVVRKYFHILAVVVYVPGLIQEGCLIYLASGIVFALFVVLELLRVLRMPPLGDTLQDGFSVFSDEKDQGALALTPIYLLAGCSLPLWLHPTAAPEQLLPLLSGVLSVGIGDTCASVSGTWFGTHKWPGGTKKTFEGTLGCISSQLLALAALAHFGYIEVPLGVCLKSVMAIIFTSVVEAKTDQVDNLALPLIMYILLL